MKALVVAVALVAVACQREPGVEPLRPVTLPDLARLDSSVQAQIRGRFAALERAMASEGTSASQRGAAQGELAMLLHAAEYYAEADAIYRNAQALMPDDPRWPYYLSHVRRAVGDPSGAIGFLTRVLELRPTDVPALVWLGRSYLDQGQPDLAEPLFTRALAEAPQTVAAKAGLAQVASDRRDYRRAIALLDEGLAIAPGAVSLHSQLATAYRALGDTARAEAHLKQWRNTDVPLVDPLREQLDLALESGLSYELRGVRVMTDGDYPQAAEFFRRGVALTRPETQLGRSLRHKLGTALFLQGRQAEAVQLFEQVIAQAPAEGQDEPTAKAYYSLGVLRASEGRTREAIAQLTRAVAFSPTYLEARLVLGDALRSTGRVEAALEQYRAAVESNPRAAEARFGYAMGLVRLRRWAEARRWLEESHAVLPDRLDLQHALARVLAAAPEAGVRDGRRASALIDAVVRGGPSPEVGETVAMIQAELGDFASAVATQRDVLAAAGRAGDQAAIRRMTANLRLYERGQPCRAPWPDDDPVHRPSPS